jgi:hypothetical protein
MVEGEREQEEGPGRGVAPVLGEAEEPERKKGQEKWMPAAQLVVLFMATGEGEFRRAPDPPGAWSNEVPVPLSWWSVVLVLCRK